MDEQYPISAAWNIPLPDEEWVQRLSISEIAATAMMIGFLKGTYWPLQRHEAFYFVEQFAERTGYSTEDIARGLFDGTLCVQTSPVEEIKIAITAEYSKTAT